MALIAPPLPAASGPSNTTSSPGPRSPGTHLPAEVQPQLQQPSLLVLESLVVLLAVEPLAQVELVEDGHRRRVANRVHPHLVEA